MFTLGLSTWEASTKERQQLIFVTVGSQRFQFNRLLRVVDACLCSEPSLGPTFAQSGWCDYAPKSFECKPFLDRAEFAGRLAECDTVITHGGTGVIVSALKQSKRVLAMPRLARYGEHVDDHQVQLLTQFSAADLIEVFEDAEALRKELSQAAPCMRRAFRSGTQSFVEDLDSWLSLASRDKRTEPLQNG